MAGVTPNTLASRLTRVQSFKETVWGTPGLATARWMLIKPTPTFTIINKSIFVDEDRGSFAPAFVSYIPETSGTFNISADASFEDINFALYAMLGAVTPTGSYTYTYTGPLTSAWNPQSYSLELAYDVATVLAQGVLANKLSIKFNAKNNWTYDLTGFFQQLNAYAAINIASSTNANPIVITTSTPLPSTLINGAQVVITGHLVNTAANGTWTITKTGASTFSIPTTGNGVGVATGTVTQTVTPSIADRVVEPILFAGETALAIDAAGGTAGTTNIPSAFVSGQLDIDNQQQGFFTGDQKYPIDFTQDKFKVTLTIKLKWNAQVKALYTGSWLAGKSTLFDIKATSGSKSAEIIFSGALSSDPQNYAVDYGAITQELKFDGIVDTGALANYLKVIVINAVASVP